MARPSGGTKPTYNPCMLSRAHPLRLALVLAALPVPFASVAGADDTAGEGDAKALEIFRRAVEAQGKLRSADVEDVRIAFRGQIIEEGEHSVRREYRYRAKDRSFYLLTAATAAADQRTERGVLAGGGFWERGSGGRVFELQPGNREDGKAIRSIRKERDQFERILRLVLLARLEDKDTRIRLVSPEPVRLEDDMPRAANGILGRDRAARTYWVLAVERPDQPRLDLWIRADEPAEPNRANGHAWSVVKAAQYDPDTNAPEWYYYFGPYDRDTRPDLLLPRYFSAHQGEPSGKDAKEATLKYHGTLEVQLNAGLTDEDLRPTK